MLTIHHATKFAQILREAIAVPARLATPLMTVILQPVEVDTLDNFIL